MTKKYELTNETIEVDGLTLFRIRALRDFGDVKAGDLGGFVQSEYNLSHSGNCWIFDNACVFGYSIVHDNARIYGKAHVYEYAFVYENAVISGNTIVSGGSTVSGNISITGTTNWSLFRSETPDDCFFNSGLDAKDAVIKTREDFIREFPEWCI